MKEKPQQKTQCTPLPDLYPRQDVLFLSLIAHQSYLEGPITGPAGTPISYMIEAKGRTYWCTQQYISPINCDGPSSFTRPSTHTPRTQMQIQPLQDHLHIHRNQEMSGAKKLTKLHPFPTALSPQATTSYIIALIQDHPSILLDPFQDHPTLLPAPSQDHFHHCSPILTCS